MRIVRSPFPNKKWRAIFQDGTHTDFGDSNYQDYTQHHSIERRRLYRIRHEKDLETHNPKAKGYLSYYILWGNSTSLQENIKEYKKRFGDL